MAERHTYSIFWTVYLVNVCFWLDFGMAVMLQITYKKKHTEQFPTFLQISGVAGVKDVIFLIRRKYKLNALPYNI